MPLTGSNKTIRFEKGESRRMIEFKNVYKTYPNGFTALKDVNLKIEQGEFVAIIGLSGAGKSTILRCINRMHDITKGTLTRRKSRAPATTRENPGGTSLQADEAHFRGGFSRLITPNIWNFQRVLHTHAATQEVP